MFTVILKHKEFGEIILKNITEIHYCYPSPMGKRIAFESDVDGTGGTYPVEDVIEFEARLTPDAADGEKPSEIIERFLRVSEETRKRLNKRKFPRR